MSKPIQLSKRERIVAVVPQKCSGPGWANQVVWVYIANGDSIRSECIQWRDFSPEMECLFESGSVMCRELVRAVEVDT